MTWKRGCVTNLFDGTVTVYESDSPAVPGNGSQGQVIATIGGFAGPRSGTWNWRSYLTGPAPAGPGCFVANAQGTTVDELAMTNFGLAVPGGPPGFRTFQIFKQHSTAAVPGAFGSPSDACIDNHSGLFDVLTVPQMLRDHKGNADPSVGGGTPSLVLVSYPAAGVLAAFDYDSQTLISTLAVPGCDALHTYYDQ